MPGMPIAMTKTAMLTSISEKPALCAACFICFLSALGFVVTVILPCVETVNLIPWTLGSLVWLRIVKVAPLMALPSNSKVTLTSFSVSPEVRLLFNSSKTNPLGNG